MVLAAVAVLPQASIAVNVLTCDLSQPLLVTVPSLDDTVGTPHASDADAVPSAAFISAADGLHPSVVVVPPVVITGAVMSAIHVIVLTAVAVLPQPSIAVHVLVCERSHPLELTVPSREVTVGVPHASDADAVPRAAFISAAVGLHPSVVVVPPVVRTGGVRSLVHVTIVEAVALLPQPSEALNVLVCEREQPLDCTRPSVTITVGDPQSAVAVAEPKAALISEAEGLQPSVGVAPVIIIAGGLGASVQVTVLTAVAVLPQASTAVNVLDCEVLHDVVDIAPSINVRVGIPQASVAVAVPSAAVISEAEGLHPKVKVVPLVVIVGGTRSLVQVIVLTAVAVLPQASTAENVLVCVCVQDPVTGPSINVRVGIPQASVAVAVPSAAVISEAEGLHPNVRVVPLVVIVGGTRSLVHVTVAEAVAELPQPSAALKVLVCDREQPLDCTCPSVTITAGVPQAAVAVAEPSAALISEAEGLQPSVGIAPVIIIAGGLGASVQVTVLTAVAVLPQASTAVNVLVCEALHDVVDIAPSINVRVGIPQASVAVAVPSAAVISEAEGLHPKVKVVPLVVIVGGTRSLVQVIVLTAVAVLPQASTAENVLVC